MLRVFSNRVGVFVCLIAIVALGTFYFAGINSQKVSATNTPQSLPFSQNWTNAGLITTDDNWSGVPGIVGYRGDDLSTVIDVDVRTVLADGSATPIDVNANRSDPDVFTTGGIVEFDGIPNPVVAFQGSGTADIPHIVLYLNTTGQSNIQVSYNARDIDNGTGIDAVQQVNTQFRVGGTGNYTNVTGGYIADASAPASATLVTPVNVTLPASANNQPIVEVRIMTTNALGSDEFIGIDDISVTGTGVVAPTQHVIDFDGNGKSDYSVVRNTGGGPSGQITWFNSLNGPGTTAAFQWGLNGDFFTPVDFDGDNKTDIAVWRGGAPGVAAFYILQSATLTLKTELFGQTGDDPTVVDDYDGDGKADPAVYRAGANAGDPSTWFYRGSLSNPSGNVTFVPWGQNGDFPAPGDYDGDGKNDFVVQRNNGGGQARFWMRQTTAGTDSVVFGTPTDVIVPGDYDGDGKNDFVVQRNNGGGQARFWMRQTTAGTDSVVFGTPTDVIVPGDYDGDGKTDIAVVRGSAGQLVWFVRPSSTGVVSGTPFATFGASATDIFTQGDYDGDGKTDVAIWRPSATPGATAFWVLGSTSGAFSVPFGQNGDFPVARYNGH
jgi:hypothetical protein